MSSRRKFITQSSVAAASLMFLKPLETAARLPGYSVATSRTVSILDIGNLFRWWKKTEALAGGFGSLEKIVNALRAQNPNSLFILTGNNINVREGSKQQHIEAFQKIKELDCDAVIPGPADLALGEDYYEQLVNLSKVNSLWAKKSGQYLLPNKILQMGYVKVGLIGTVGSADSDVTIEAINHTATHLQDCEVCNMLIAIHTPVENDANNSKLIEMSETSAGINLMISRNSPIRNFKAFASKNKDAAEVILSFSGVNSGPVKQLDFVFNDNMQMKNVGFTDLA